MMMEHMDICRPPRGFTQDTYSGVSLCFKFRCLKHQIFFFPPCHKGVVFSLILQIISYNIPGKTGEFGSPTGGPTGRCMAVECPVSWCSLSLVPILQMALPPYNWGLQDDKGGESSRFLRNFISLFLLTGLFGRHSVLLRLRLGLIEAGDFLHVGLT